MSSREGSPVYLTIVSRAVTLITRLAFYRRVELVTTTAVYQLYLYTYITVYYDIVLQYCVGTRQAPYRTSIYTSYYDKSTIINLYTYNNIITYTFFCCSRRHLRVGV